MENFKFFLFSVFVIVILGVGGYWAFSTMESGSSHVDNQKQKELEKENENLKEEISDLKDQLVSLQSKQTEEEQKSTETTTQTAVSEPSTNTKTPTTTNTGTSTSTGSKTATTTATSKYQTLINDLQKLVNSNAYLKLKSQGPAVGTIQKFLNVYNGTSNKIDNDFGTSTATAVKNFQKAQGLTADGEVGVGTLKKMISWLKSH